MLHAKSRLADGYYIGLMSGTSLDGVDAALLQMEEGNARLTHTVFQPFSEEIRHELLALNQAGDNELQRAAIAGNALAQRYAATIVQLLREADISPGAIAAIGCHGQTVRHRPDLGFTIQIGNPALLAELTGIRVVADFRSRDIAAGGQGAPLVPAFHAALFRASTQNRVIVNIGGISNLTWLPASGTVTGFDCGPGNLLLDAWALQHLGTPYDHNGAWAAGGNIIPGLLHALLAHPFLEIHPPKSTGRDMFHLAWLQTLLSPEYAPIDVQATLLEFSARAVANAVTRHCTDADEIYLCGGGAHNSALRIRLAELLPQTVALTDELGIAADWVEAAAFAWLARQTQLGLPGNLPEVTGAHHPSILGAIHPA